MFCKNCGTQFGQANFCPNCGATTNEPQGVNQQSNSQYQYSSQYNPQYVNPQPTKSVGLIEAFVLMFKNYANFKGRSRRSEYWMAAVANYIILFIADILLSAFILNKIETEAGLVVLDNKSMVICLAFVWIYMLVMLVPALALVVRRLHDIGKSGKSFFLIFIPVVGSIILLVYLVKDSMPGPNEYGPNPKGIN